MQVQAASWSHPQAVRIQAVAPATAHHSTLGLSAAPAAPLIYMAAGGNEVGLWDAGSGACQQVCSSLGCLILLLPDLCQKREALPVQVLRVLKKDQPDTVEPEALQPPPPAPPHTDDAAGLARHLDVQVSVSWEVLSCALQLPQPALCAGCQGAGSPAARHACPAAH